MKIHRVVDEIYRVSVNIEEKGYLFEGIWPVPSGVSINGYLIKGDRNVLIDLTQDIMDFPAAFSQQIESASISIEDIDILVINHMEPDHSGWLKDFCRKNYISKNILVSGSERQSFYEIAVRVTSCHNSLYKCALIRKEDFFKSFKPSTF